MDTVSPAQDPWLEQALARWPNVPAVYGWLALDPRGRWCLRDGPVTHAGLNAFLARHYRVDSVGRWFVQNGPQQVFVDLASAPFVATLTANGNWVAHTGAPVVAPNQLLVDESARLYLVCTLGLVALSDRDLAAFLAQLRSTERAEDPGDLLLRLTGPAAPRTLDWRGCRLVAHHAPEASLEARFGYCRHPQA